MTGLTPDITAVTAIRHGVLRLAFADGLTGERASSKPLSTPDLDDRLLALVGRRHPL